MHYDEVKKLTWHQQMQYSIIYA